jgi:hypothetical protein
MFEDLQFSAVLLEESAGLVGEGEGRGPGARMRKVGGILTNQLSERFTSIEAAFMHDVATCASCRSAPRAEGRLRCSACELAQRRAKMTPGERQALKLKGLEIGRQRAREGKRVGRLDLWS